MLASLLLLLSCQPVVSSAPLLWPQPASLLYNTSATPLSLSPCDVVININSPITAYLSSMVSYYR